jgi:Na+/melibiose symporter-like transporter
MPEPNFTDTARRRELLDAIGKTSELHHHALLVLAVLIGAQGIAAASGQKNVLIFIAMIVSVLTFGARLWVYQDLLMSIRLRLRPLLDGEEPTRDAKTKQELDWLTQQDPWLERLSVWGLWLSAVLFAGSCFV